jgi:hypothetical protein
MGWTMGLEPWSDKQTTPTPPLQEFSETDRDHINNRSRSFEKARGLNTNRGNGVDDGTRTHDDRDHNPGLYQLSYAHHGSAYITKSQAIWRARQDSNLQPSA